MVNPAMVRHHVHDDFQPFFVSLGDHFPVKLVSPEARIDPVIVRAGIAMVGLLLQIVLQKGSGPDGSRPKAGDVVQMVYDALNVSSVTAERSFAVAWFGSRRGRIIRGVAISEAIRIY